MVAMINSPRSLRLVIVTPEKTVFDEPASSMRFPLYDGDIGILPGRLPLIGRLGAGELHVRLADAERSFFVDGGFVQVRGGVVTLLTDRAVPVEQLSASAAEAELEAARSRRAKTEAELDLKEHALRRARRLVSVARKAR
jgi:F-type H+-transporting ATPase subunit epsilon